MAVTTPAWLRRREPLANGGGAPAARRSTVQSASSDVQAVAAAALPSGIVVYQFGTDDLGASASAEQLYRALPGSAMSFAQIGIQPLFRGSIIGLSIGANAAKTGGTATFEVYVEGVASGAQLEWADELDLQTAQFNPEDFPFMSADELDIRVTTSSTFTPTTVDVEVLLYIAQLTLEDLV